MNSQTSQPGLPSQANKKYQAKERKPKESFSEGRRRNTRRQVSELDKADEDFQRI